MSSMSRTRSNFLGATLCAAALIFAPGVAVSASAGEIRPLYSSMASACLSFSRLTRPGSGAPASRSGNWSAISRRPADGAMLFGQGKQFTHPAE